MEKGKSPCLPPPSGRLTGFSSSSTANASNSFNPNTQENNNFSRDISEMPDNPPKNLGHRRAHSEIPTVPGGIRIESDIGIVEADDEPYSDETEEDLVSMYFDMDKFDSSTCSVTSSFQVGDSSSSAAAPVEVGAGSEMLGGNIVSDGVGLKTRARHQHSISMDGTSSVIAEMLMSGPGDLSPAQWKKAISAAKLAELALVDPKRAKRIWANRQSAARSKERKMRYIGELEKKEKTLQTEAASVSAQLTLLQREGNCLNAEHCELKLLLQATEQQVHLQDALNEARKEEIQHLKMLTGQCMPNGGPMMNFASLGDSMQYYPNNQAMQSLLAAQQFQQLQIQSPNHQQHQFEPPQQHHQVQQQHPTGEMRAGGTMFPPNQKDSSSEGSSTASKD